MIKGIRIFLLFIVCITLFGKSGQCQSGEWVWIKGTNYPDNPGNYGTPGVTSSSNYPCTMKSAFSWTDSIGNFWLFGGYNKFNLVYADLWKYEPATNNWTWKKGNHQSYFAGNYGTQGIAAATNNPSSRTDGATWTDLQGNLWLFGGIKSAGNYYSDLWKFDISLNQWVWVKGPDNVAQPGIYGIMGVPSILNNPAACYTVVSWTDNAGDLWMFGGNTGSSLNTLWRYNIATNMWTWMKGSNLPNPDPVFGIKDVESATNDPGGILVDANWKDMNGNFWMFGGWRAVTGYSNQLWRFNLITNNWTWISGDSITNYSGSYGNVCVDSVTNVPRSCKGSSATWKDDNGNLLFYGGFLNSSSGYSDFWRYCLAGNTWTLQRSNGGVNWGTIGVSSPSNTPGFRFEATSWKDGNGNLYLFGGQNSLGKTFNDLWKYVIDSTCGNCVTPLGVDDIHIADEIFTFYPNPANEKITLVLNRKNIFGTMTILNSIGEIILTEKISETSTMEISVKNLSKGIYIIRINTDCVLAVRKMVIQ